MTAIMQAASSRSPSISSFARRYGPWAVITGASDGIGRAFAGQLAAQGIDVVLVARRADVLEELGAELRSTRGVQVRVVASDLTERTGVDAVLDATASLDVGLLVAAAGYGTSGRFVTLPREAELAMIDVNCRAVTELAHAFGARFAARGRGGLVLLSSLLAFQGVARASTYAATKAFVQSLAEGLRLELAADGVDVVAAAPGPTRSGFASRARMQMSFATAPDVVARETLRMLGQRTTVRPGWLSKLLEWSLRLNPRAVRVRILSQIMQGMTRHQTA